MTEPLLSLADVQFRWPGSSGFRLNIPQFSLARGESTLLLGESGVGKSTLLSLICGALTPESGSIHVAGQDIVALSNAARDRFRAEHIGVVFQQFNLLPFGSVGDNIALPLRFAPQRRLRVGDVKRQAARLCTALGLAPSVLHARAHTLSVGQQQRVAVARALIGQPPLILADEPTSALDADNQTSFLDLLFHQLATNEASLLMVSHDARLAAHFDRVVQMTDIATVSEVAA
ncbi:MAG: ABC transporter ATP-binding protein [Pseudomonadota bacterium]